MNYDRSSAMLSYVSEYYKSSRIYREQNAAKGAEIDTIRTLIDEMKLQFTPQTATWGIGLWEELCGLPSIPSEALESRRSKVLTILGVVTPMTEKTLESIILTSTGAMTDIIDTEQAYVLRAVISEFLRNYDFEVIKGILRNTAPAHILFEMEYLFPPVSALNVTHFVFSEFNIHCSVKEIPSIFTPVSLNVEGLGAKHSGSFSGSVTIDSRWYLDGTYMLDGTRHLDAGITTEEL